MKQLSLSERLNQFATDQDDLSRRGEKNLAAEAAQAIDSLTAERDQLAAQVEALKQGVYHFNCSHGDLNPLLKAVMESPKQCLDYIRAKAVMNFAELPRETYLSGDVTAELTVYDVYQSARNHVKANYGYDTKAWDDDDATTASNSLNEQSAKAIRKFVSDTNETGQLSFPDCQWLEQWRDEWLEEAAKGSE